eukprot:evm.model.scf_809.3 EVM.evm.TU.scf_809.3   scf_809:51663-58750(-)
MPSPLKRKIDTEGHMPEKRQKLGQSSSQVASPGLQESVQPAPDAFALELSRILDRVGGVSLVRNVPGLERLMDSEQRLNYRWTLLTVIELSSEECLKALVQGPGLKTLERWLIEARDAGKSEFLAKIISRLEDLPVDIDSLKRCTIGKTVGSLRKHSLPSVKSLAARVVQKWKSSLGDRSGQAKQDRDGGKKEAPNKRKPVTEMGRPTSIPVQPQTHIVKDESSSTDVQPADSGDPQSGAMDSEHTVKQPRPLDDGDRKASEASGSSEADASLQNHVSGASIELESSPSSRIEADGKGNDGSQEPSACSQDAKLEGQADVMPLQGSQAEVQKAAPLERKESGTGAAAPAKSRPSQPTWQDVSRVVNYGRILVAESVQRAQARSAATETDNGQQGQTDNASADKDSDGESCRPGSPGHEALADADNLPKGSQLGTEPPKQQGSGAAAKVRDASVEVGSSGSDKPAVSGAVDPDVSQLKMQPSGSGEGNLATGNAGSMVPNAQGSTPVASSTRTPTSTAPRVPRPWPTAEPKKEAKETNQALWNATDASSRSSPFQDAMTSLTRMRGPPLAKGARAKWSESNRAEREGVGAGPGPGRLGGLNSDFLPQRGRTVLYGAAARAASAAARCPSPERRPKKPNAKKVSFAPNNEMLTVRWFKKDDPPTSVKQDALLKPEELQEEQVTSHELFESAARLEHKKEHEALERQRQEQAAKRKEIQGRLNGMRPATSWHAPLVVTLPSELKLRFGEDSEERINQWHRDDMLVPENYSRAAMIPDSPAEAPRPEPQGDPPVVIPFEVPGKQNSEPPSNSSQPDSGAQVASAAPTLVIPQVPVPAPIVGTPGTAIPLPAGLHPAVGQFQPGQFRQLGQGFQARPGQQTIVVLQQGMPNGGPNLNIVPSVPMGGGMGPLFIAGPAGGPQGLVQIAPGQQWGVAPQHNVMPQFTLVCNMPGQGGFAPQTILNPQPMVNIAGAPTAPMNGDIGSGVTRASQPMEREGWAGQKGNGIQAHRFQG